MQTAADITASATASELARVTALQIVARMDVQSALPSIMQTAQLGETLPLRISAVGALGAFNSPEVKDFLIRTLNSKEAPLRLAAKQSLHRIKLAEQQSNRRS
jgi:HEAT repeat protein